MLHEPLKTTSTFIIISGDPESEPDTGTITITTKEVGERCIVIYEVQLKLTMRTLKRTIASRSELERYLEGLQDAYDINNSPFPNVVIPGH